VRLGRGELDIVAQHDKLIVFVEVKVHRSHAAALQAMHPDKCARLRSAAENWLSRHPEYCDWPCRFDLIILTLGVGLAARLGPHI
jgi:putative endonuclease